MPRLFVDCDDTLVLWQDEHANQDKSLWLQEKYEMNVPLIGDINCWLSEHPKYTLIVWSGGGVDYAGRWAEKAQFQHPFMVLPKDMRTPSGDDICIDDMYGELAPRDKRVRVFSPDTSHCPICT